MKNSIIASFLAITIFNITFGYGAQNAPSTASTTAKLKCAFEAACQKYTGPTLAVLTDEDSPGSDQALPPGVVRLMGDPVNPPEINPVGQPVLPAPIVTANDNKTQTAPPNPRKALKKYPITGAVIGLIVGGGLGALALQAVTGSLLVIVAGATLAALTLGGIGFLIGNLLAIDKIASDIFPE